MAIAINPNYAAAHERLATLYDERPAQPEKAEEQRRIAAAIRSGERGPGVRQPLVGDPDLSLAESISRSVSHAALAIRPWRRRSRSIIPRSDLRLVIGSKGATYELLVAGDDPGWKVKWKDVQIHRMRYRSPGDHRCRRCAAAVLFPGRQVDRLLQQK